MSAAAPSNRPSCTVLLAVPAGPLPHCVFLLFGPDLPSLTCLNCTARFIQVVPVDPGATTASYRAWCVEAIAADIKDSICRVSDNAFDPQVGCLTGGV